MSTFCHRLYFNYKYYIGGAMVSMLAWSAVDRGFELSMRSKRKDWLPWNQVNVSEWNDMSTHGLLFQ
jgi:hypothetical protein